MRAPKPIALLLVLTPLFLGSLAFAQPPATESGFVQVEDDVRLFYQRFGTGTPKVFIPNRHELWPTLASLLHFHDVVTWDPRGRGMSDRPDDLSRYGLEVELADAEKMREHFGADDITYVGISLWGSVAVLYAARHPQSVERVVALGPLPVQASLMGESDDPIVHALTAEIAELEAIEREGRVATDWYRHCVLSYRVGFSDSYADLANMAPLEAANMCQYPNDRFDKILPVVFEGIFGSFGDWDWRDEVAGVTAPVLLLYGAREGWGVGGVRLYTDLLQDVGWVEFPDTGHHVWNERLDVVVPMMDTFFRGQWPEGVNR
jgi:pimeloyl-ACP methyl ester carboxylesterase